MLFMGYPITALPPFEDILFAFLRQSLEPRPKPLVPVIELEAAVGSTLCSGLAFSVFLEYGKFLFFLAWLCVNLIFLLFWLHFIHYL